MTDEPFFKAEDFFDSPASGKKNAENANAKVLPLQAELANLRGEVKRLEHQKQLLFEENTRLLTQLEAEPAEDTFRSLSEGKRLVVQYKALVTKLRAQLEVVTAQNRTRGYPTGIEWVEMIRRMEEIKKGQK